MALKVPEVDPPKTIQYTDLKGVDWSKDASLIDRHHAADILNMISDEGGAPIKRKGWEVLRGEADILGEFVNGFKQKENHIVVGDAFNEVYEVAEDEQTHLWERTSIGTLPAPPNCIYYAKTPKGEGLWVLTELGMYLIHEKSEQDTTLEIITPDTTIPTLNISKTPSTGAGTPYQDINRVGELVMDSFLTADEPTATSFKLSIPASTTRPCLFEYMDATGEWQTDNTAQFQDAQTVTITTEHGEPPVRGTDNIRITYERKSATDGAFFKCRNQEFYSQGSSDHVFFTGSPDAPQRVYWSAIGDPTYIPETNYIELGSDRGECMGFLHVGENLVVVKSEEGNAYSTLFQVYSTSLSTTTLQIGDETKTSYEYTYAVKRILSAAGGISHDGFGLLGDEPLFLSNDGLMGLTTLTGTAERIVRNRSTFVNKRLLKEPNIDKAEIIVNNNYLYVFVNEHVYVFDGRHKTSDSKNNSNYVYEAYYWDRVPAKNVIMHNDEMFFIHKQQKTLCRFKNTDNLSDYSDGSHIEEVDGRYIQVDGEPIKAVYSLRNDDDNAPQFFKTMLKKGSMCTIQPYDHTSVTVYTMVDANPGQSVGTLYTIGQYLADIFSFSNIDFSRFTFDSRTGPRDFFFRKKRKKYIRLQLIFENNVLDEPFGLHNVIKTYTQTRYAK